MFFPATLLSVDTGTVNLWHNEQLYLSNSNFTDQYGLLNVKLSSWKCSLDADYLYRMKMIFVNNHSIEYSLSLIILVVIFWLIGLINLQYLNKLAIPNVHNNLPTIY